MLHAITAEDGVVLDIRYATADNLTGRPIYKRPVAFLLPLARQRLLHANTMALALGLRLKVFDAYRPIEAQQALWDAVDDKRFVSDPKLGGLHSRGVAVDLTLIDAATGDELPMGTGFDAIDEASAHACLDVPVADQRNRLLLLGLMTAAGFEPYRQEWWHYQLPDARAWPALRASVVPGGPM